MSSTTRPIVLFVRLSAIGDIVMASGLPANLKQSFSDAKVVWLVEQPYADLVASHPQVDEVITWPKSRWQQLRKARKWLTLWREFRAFRNTLKSYQFTHAIEVQGLLKSAFMTWLSGASKRIGFRSKEHSHLMLTQVYDKPMSPMISSEYRYLGEQLGASEYHLTLGISDTAKAEAQALFERTGLYAPYLVLCPFTTRPQKHWPLEHWKALIARLSEQYKMAIVILGAKADKKEADYLVNTSAPVYSLAGELSLTGSAAIIEQAAAVIGVDTGMTHIAITLNRPTLALFGSTRPYTQTDNDRTRVLYEDLACAPCKRRPTCNGRFDCMQDLSVEKVMQSLAEFI